MLSPNEPSSRVFVLSALARSHGEFQPFRPGVELKPIYGTPGAAAAAAVLRYAPGASLPRHEHTGYEHIFVLEGEQRDERGTYGPGTLIINAPGSHHDVTSPSGCVVLVIWERPVRF